MYEIDKNQFESMLKAKFISMVGSLCERIENLEKQNLSSKLFANQVKFDLKKDAYNTMREIRDQVDTFSKGVKITVNLFRPASK